jgi:hypothetical protein
MYTRAIYSRRVAQVEWLRYAYLYNQLSNDGGIINKSFVKEGPASQLYSHYKAAPTIVPYGANFGAVIIKNLNLAIF